MEANEPITNESTTISISDLKSFTIRGLFGYKDIVLPLDKEVLILIAENGAGKTEILNILYQFLTKNLLQLFLVDEEYKQGSTQSEYVRSLSLEFKNNTDVEILFKYKDIYLKDNFPSIELDRSLGWLPEEDKKTVKNAIESSLFNFKRNFNSHNIFYLPTYRRIEKKLQNLGYKTLEREDSLAKDFVEKGIIYSQGVDRYRQLLQNKPLNQLIKFGIEDIKILLRQIQTEIKNIAFDSFSRVTGEMLTQFIEGLKVTPEMRESINIDILDLILSRVGEKNMSKNEQERIKKLVSSGEINDSKYDDLVYFLSKLINLYESQRKIDETIKSFINVCNKYLNPNKEIVYNESTAEIYIKQTRNNQTIELNNLSSGEKQIISLFSKVYLEAEEDFILIIDEPELSISVEWQQMLLPDIMRSGKCKRLIAATHSPFIFDNELDHCAYALNQFVTEH